MLHAAGCQQLSEVPEEALGTLKLLQLQCIALAQASVTYLPTYKPTASTEVQASLATELLLPFLNILCHHNAAVPYSACKALRTKLLLLDAELGGCW